MSLQTQKIATESSIVNYIKKVFAQYKLVLGKLSCQDSYVGETFVFLSVLLKENCHYF